MIQGLAQAVSASLGCFALALCCVVASDAQTPPDEFRPLRPELEKFIVYMAHTHGFDARELRVVFAKVQD